MTTNSVPWSSRRHIEEKVLALGGASLGSAIMVCGERCSRTHELLRNGFRWLRKLMEEVQEVDRRVGSAYYSTETSMCNMRAALVSFLKLRANIFRWPSSRKSHTPAPARLHRLPISSDITVTWFAGKCLTKCREKMTADGDWFETLYWSCMPSEEATASTIWIRLLSFTNAQYQLSGCLEAACNTETGATCRCKPRASSSRRTRGLVVAVSK
ncbi:hypothetical protein F5Y01DRAFT_83464 [Xylaria sp. FL0043]|nr:hypothetical protein F5Y01DRAFT_83464 [Xylaria sp. FL0043]